MRGCLKGDPRRAVDEARRLVEGEGVDIVLSRPDDEEGAALALYGKTQPDKTFVDATSALQEATLGVEAANVFRFVPDAAQRAAGLGTYAYEELGWRAARIDRDATPFALQQAAAFAVEFCRLGGRLVERGGDGTFVSRGRRARVDGVESRTGGRSAVAALARALRAARDDLSDGHRALRDELARGLDENRQPVVTVDLVSRGKVVRRVDDIEQSFAGAFDGEEPLPEQPACERR